MKRIALPAVLLLCAISLGVSADAPIVDPGPRGGPAAAGSPLPGLTPDQLRFFVDGQARMQSVDTVATGLGPFYNSRDCALCHAQPAIGGSSPALNPQIADANADGAANVIPNFISPAGPVREARFVLNANGTPDGGVHDLFSISGRSDAVGCQLAQPDFAAQEAAKNIIFRIPTPVFGLGLIENIDDATILANQFADQKGKEFLGIHGAVNRSGNDGTITRFGWKAQNKSGLIFAGEAYNVEVGVTNEAFETERAEPGHSLPAACKFNGTPEDSTNFLPTGSDTTQVPSDIVQFADFMRLLAAPTAAPATLQTLAGAGVFNSVGCALCHTPTLTTAVSSVTPALSQVPANLFSDLLVHDMGQGLADGVSQGGAAGNQFRTAPLWGVGQRLFFLHDGRCADLVCAIEAHQSAGSEANRVIQLFNARPAAQRQNLILFLRSL
jgi:CxxC motif-containing protein (DUF1111 family)